MEEFRSVHYLIFRHSDYAELRRTVVPLDLRVDLLKAHEPMLRVLEKTRSMALLIDLRQAPPRMEPDSQTLIAPLRRALIEGQRRISILVATQVGKLEVQRHQREDGGWGEIAAFCDEGEAIGFARGTHPFCRQLASSVDGHQG